MGIRPIHVLKEESAGAYYVMWYTAPYGNYGVQLLRKSKFSKRSNVDFTETLKSWEFGKTPISEATTLYWYNYIKEALDRRKEEGNKKFPFEIRDTTVEEIETVVSERFKDL